MGVVVLLFYGFKFCTLELLKPLIFCFLYAPESI